MPGMNSSELSSTARWPAQAQGLAALAQAGLLSLAVPAEMGGAGGSFYQLAQAARALCQQDAAAWAVLRAQRLAIEALVQARNVGLREYLLPDLLAGHRAATVPSPLTCPPLSGTDTGRGWRLHGRLPRSANLDAAGFTLIAPVRLGDEAPTWVALRGEEDGLDALAPAAPVPAWASAARLGELRCRGFFFREDEWLGDQEITARLQLLEDELRQAQLSAV